MLSSTALEVEKGIRKEMREDEWGRMSTADAIISRFRFTIRGRERGEGGREGELGERFTMTGSNGSKGVVGQITFLKVVNAKMHIRNVQWMTWITTNSTPGI